MRLLAIFLVFCTFVASYGHNVLTFKSFDDLENDARDILGILMRNRIPERFLPLSYFHKYRINPADRLTSFKFKNCGDPAKESAILENLAITPDPVHLPGPISVTFDLDTTKLTSSPVQATTLMKKKILGHWVEIPCVDQLGSCHFDDFCDILNMIPQCPGPFVEKGIPCKCPVPQGIYSLPKTNFEIPISFFPAGDYYARINMTMNSELVTCIEVNLSFN